MGKIGLIAVLLSGLAFGDITFITWGGVYGKAQQKHMVDPFMKKTGINVKVGDYKGGTAEIKAQVALGNPSWDVVDFVYVDGIKACSEGLLEVIPTKDMPDGADGTPATKDFYADAQKVECLIGNIYWSIIYAYDKKNFAKDKPTTIKDFFDIKKFPGKRGMRKRAQINLEWALIADGVAMDSVYDVLETEAGVKRAFKKLDTIKKDIVWYESWSQAPQLLNDETVTMVQSANGRVLDFEIIWDAQAFDLDGLAILKGSKNKEEALKFIKFATSTKPLIGMVDVNYGPTRASSSKLLTQTQRDGLPSSHLDEGFGVSGEFWSDYSTELNEKYNVWLLK